MAKSKIIIILSLAVLLAYGMSMQYGFSQDDWFHLSISKAGSIKDFFNFFNPFDVSWIFFRPLSTQLPYWFAYSIFGLDIAPYFMHFLMLLVHLANAYIVVQIASQYLQSNLSLLLGLMYAISNTHFLSLYYIGAIQQLISTFFSLIAIYLVTAKPKPSPFSLAILTLCALLSKELALRLPPILLLLTYLNNHNIFKSLKIVFSSILVAVAYVIFRLIIGNAGASEYVVNFSLSTTLATLMWYGLFIMSFPEKLLSYGLSAGRINILGFLQDFGLLGYFVLITATILGILFILRLLYTLKNPKTSNSLLYLLLAFISILPVIFLPTHRYPHYLDLTLLFLGIWVLQNIELNLRVYLYSAIVAMGIISSINIETSTHWTTQRAIKSKEIAQKIIAEKACTSSTGVTFTGSKTDLQEIAYAMSIANGPRIICQNTGLQVYYKELP